MLAKLFKSPIFTWWNSATIGTLLFTRRHGVKVGEDDQGNVYYTNKDKSRRWVIYGEGGVEASRVPAEWHAWLHHTVKDSPAEQPLHVKAWEKDHQPNLTGSDNAYFPGGSLSHPGARQSTAADYEAWAPGD